MTRIDYLIIGLLSTALLASPADPPAVVNMGSLPEIRIDCLIDRSLGVPWGYARRLVNSQSHVQINE